MRLFALFILPCLASAGSLEHLVPRPAPPKGLQLRAPSFSTQTRAERARGGAPVAQQGAPDPLGRPRQDLPLSPYPNQVPARYRGFLHGY